MHASFDLKFQLLLIGDGVLPITDPRLESENTIDMCLQALPAAERQQCKRKWRKLWRKAVRYQYNSSSYHRRKKTTLEWQYKWYSSNPPAQMTVVRNYYIRTGKLVL